VLLGRARGSPPPPLLSLPLPKHEVEPPRPPPRHNHTTKPPTQTCYRPLPAAAQQQSHRYVCETRRTSSFRKGLPRPAEMKLSPLAAEFVPRSYQSAQADEEELLVRLHTWPSEPPPPTPARDAARARARERERAKKALLLTPPFPRLTPRAGVSGGAPPPRARRPDSATGRPRPYAPERDPPRGFVAWRGRAGRKRLFSFFAARGPKLALTPHTPRRLPFPSPPLPPNPTTTGPRTRRRLARLDGRPRRGGRDGGDV
jgi:hypothetical protein